MLITEQEYRKLQQFHSDEAMQEAFRSFVFKVLDEEALERVYKGKETAHIKLAKEVLNRAFTELSKMFEQERKREISNDFE